MAQTIKIFSADYPAKVNSTHILQQAATQYPNVVVDFENADGYTTTPRDINGNEMTPVFNDGYILFDNVPDNITETQIKTWLANQSASETDKEEARRLRREQILNIIKSKIDEIEARLDALENP